MANSDSDPFLRQIYETCKRLISGISHGVKTYPLRDTGVTINIRMDATKIKAAKKLLSEQGCRVDRVMHAGRDWFQIDYCKQVAPLYGGSDITVSLGPFGLATPDEMKELADGVYTPDELLELLLKRRADEKGGAEPC